MLRFCFLSMKSYATFFALMGSLLLSSAWAKSELKMNFKMTPSAGNFETVSQNIQGSAKVDGTKITAENIIVPISSLDAGMPLRTKHMKEKYLEMDKFPNAKLIKGEGVNGKGKGLIEIHGVQKEIEGTYKVEGSEVVANFNLKISDFKIEKVKYLGVGVDDEFKIEVRIPTTSVSAATPIKK